MRRVWDKRPYPVDETTPKLRDVCISGVRARACTACAGFFYGLAEAPVEGVTLRDVTVEMTKDGAAGYPAMMDGCPEMRGAGFFLRNARQVTFSDVRVLGVQGEEWNIDDSVEVCR